MKKIIFIFIILILAALAFFGIYHVPANLIYVIDSKIQGKKILYSKKWGFFPESIIPGAVETERIPNSFTIYHKNNFILPYSEVIDVFNVFKIDLAFNIKYVFNETNVNKLYHMDIKEIKAELIQKVVERINKIIISNMGNENFSREVFLNSLKASKENLGIDIEFSIIFFPLWKNYYSMVSKIENQLKLSEDVILNQLLENYRRLIIKRSENKNLSEYFTVLSEISKNLSKTPEKDLILRLFSLINPQGPK